MMGSDMMRCVTSGLSDVFSEQDSRITARAPLYPHKILGAITTKVFYLGPDLTLQSLIQPVLNSE